MKVPTNYWKIEKQAMKEIRALTHIQSPYNCILLCLQVIIITFYRYIIKLLGVSFDPLTEAPVLVMEFVEGGTLRDLLYATSMPLSWDNRLSMLVDIISGIKDLHHHNPQVISAE